MMEPIKDPKRGTGRTSREVRAAAVAACLGNRVMYVTHSSNGMDHARCIAVDLLKDAGIPESRISITRECITIYLPGGATHGILRFCSMDSRMVGSYFDNPAAYQANPDGINRGLRDGLLYRIVVDHYVYDELNERAAKKQRQQDCGLILQLMRKYGYTDVVAKNDGSIPIFLKG